MGAAIAYNVWQYYEVTGDLEFLVDYGAEMLLEMARFWASATTYDARLERYEIRGVMGPDEYHDRYPGADRFGLNKLQLLRQGGTVTREAARREA